MYHHLFRASENNSWMHHATLYAALAEGKMRYWMRSSSERHSTIHRWKGWHFSISKKVEKTCSRLYIISLPNDNKNSSTSKQPNAKFNIIALVCSLFMHSVLGFFSCLCRWFVHRLNRSRLLILHLQHYVFLKVIWDICVIRMFLVLLISRLFSHFLFWLLRESVYMPMARTNAGWVALFFSWKTRTLEKCLDTMASGTASGKK